MTPPFSAHLAPAKRSGRYRYPAALACVLLLGACAALPPPAPVPDAAAPQPPARWGTQADHGASSAPGATTPTDLAGWWGGLQDPLLSALVLQALQANTDVRGAQAALQQARAARDGRAAGMGPTVRATGGAQSSKTGGNTASNTFQAGFDAGWEPDVFGANRSALQAAESDAQATRLTLAQVQVSVAAEVAVRYIELRASQTRLALLQSSLLGQADAMQIARWRAQAGLVSALDVAQAEAAHAQSAAQIPALQTSIGQALNSLAVLVAQAPGALHATLAAPGAIPVPPDHLALALPADTLRQRADVRAAEARVHAALARLSQADAARYPSLSLSGSLGLRALSLGALTGGATLAQALAASLSVPVWDGGAAQAQVRSQEAALAQARASHAAVVLGALQEVEDALLSLQGNRARLASLTVAALAGADAERLARQRYASGLVDFRAVLQAQASLLAAQDNAASTRASLSADHVRLYKVLGGGWQPDTPTPSSVTP